MLDNALQFLQNAGNAVYSFVMWPGEQAISALVLYSPGAAAWLAIDESAPPVLMTFLFSLVVWFLVIVLIAMIGRFLRNIFRILEAIVRTAWFRASLFAREVKTQWMLRFRRLKFWKKSAEVEEASLVDLDDTDIAVLHTASSKGPGFAVSAPELAEQFRLRPAQVQRILKKLSSYKMLDYVIGSTDGYDNFKLTDYGSAYVATHRRQTAHS